MGRGRKSRISIVTSGAVDRDFAARQAGRAGGTANGQTQRLHLCTDRNAPRRARNDGVAESRRGDVTAVQRVLRRCPAPVYHPPHYGDRLLPALRARLGRVARPPARLQWWGDIGWGDGVQALVSKRSSWHYRGQIR